ncbi:MAG: AAA family ATPase [bacterium]|nr:AAA family ATPase [bacterium]
MYTEFYKLREKPFENVSDPRFFFRSVTHEEGFSRMLYVAREEKGCGMLTGGYGTGKTFVMDSLMTELTRSGRKAVMLPNPSFDSTGILKEIIYRMEGKREEGDKVDIFHSLEESLLSYAREKKNAVIIVDEAHSLHDEKVLEELRMLLNLHYEGKFLLTLLLSGQPELDNIIKGVRQFDQRVFLRYFLKGLTEEETRDYVLFRLTVAGVKEQLFTEDALNLICEQSGGIPRRINTICDLALLFGFYEKKEKIDRKTIEEVIRQNLEK